MFSRSNGISEIPTFQAESGSGVKSRIWRRIWPNRDRQNAAIFPAKGGWGSCRLCCLLSGPARPGHSERY